jgi:hypothetical protein
MKSIAIKTNSEGLEMNKKLKKESTLKQFTKSIDQILKKKYPSNGKQKQKIPNSPKMI